MDNRSRVLIVDDMSINRLVLSSLLATHGVMSDQAENGSECISLCEKKEYDLILLDHRMPDLDGVDTLVRLKEIFKEKGREVPIVCHTTEEGKQNINLYKAAGFADVLIKPIEPRELFDVIMTYLPDKAGLADIDAGPDAPAAALTPDDLTPSEEDTRLEIEKLPLWLKIVPHIDLVAGIANCGSADDYMDALYIFYSSIGEKSDEIRIFVQAEDWTMYALRVHSLKSIARLVGAKKLSDMAAALEKAARENDIATVRRDTHVFLDTYREFSTLLAPFEEDEAKKAMKKLAEEQNSKASEPVESTDHSHCVLLIQSGQVIVKKGIENNLSAAGFTVITIPDEPDQIIAHRSEADIIVYYPGLSDNSHIGINMNLLGEICQDDSKILCLTGEMTDIQTAMLTNGAYRVTKSYPRPVDIEMFVKDMEYFAELEADYHRRKTIFVVDDDSSYLPIIDHWLSDRYNVSCFSSAEDALDGLNTVTPDLMLLDYEMPGINGCELMKSIRTNFPDEKIPIIFLTGKNDKELVFRVLEFKPDGYLLKSSQKETILDVIHRFFAESMFRLSLLPKPEPPEEP